MSEREYVIGTSPEGRPTLTVNQEEEDIPFNVWRDIGRLAGRSSSSGFRQLTFEFLVAENLPKALEILHGAMFKEKKDVG